MSALMPGELSASPEDPLAWLEACHHRIESRLVTLERLGGHLQQCGVDESARRAITSIIRYFEMAAPDHHADEEQDLFPRLLVYARTHGDRTVIDALGRAERTHPDLERTWSSLHMQLTALTGMPVAAPLLAPEFAAAYREHIALESEIIFPAARRWLGAADLLAIGAAMAARRGLTASAG